MTNKMTYNCLISMAQILIHLQKRTKQNCHELKKQPMPFGYKAFQSKMLKNTNAEQK